MAVSYQYPPAQMNTGMMPGPPMQAPGGYPSMYGSFAFKKRFEPIDWKKIASADIDSISRNLDFNTLQENVMNITFCNIESEVDSRMIDPNFIKLFKLAQLTIEYLLHSQDYLSSMVGTLEAKLKKALEEHQETKKTLEQTKTEFSELRKECHKRKKMLMAQQQILQAGANSYNKCPYCSKAFVNVTFLQSHLTRRHPEHMSQYNSMAASQLHYHSMPPQHIQVPGENGEIKVQQAEKDAELERELGEIKERLRLTESQLVDERNARNTLTKQDRENEEDRADKRKETDRQRQEDERRHKSDLEKMQKSFMKELREMNEKYLAQGELVEGLQRKLGKSGLGDLEDDHERALLRQQREENAMLKEQLQHQVHNVEEMNRQRDKEFQSKLQTMQKQHTLQLEELNDALEQSVADLDERKQENDVELEYERRLTEANNVLQKANIEETENNKDNVQQAIKEEANKVMRKSSERVRTSMDPGSEDELTTTFGTGTLNKTLGTGSLSLSATRQQQLMELIRKNPEFLKGMRNQLNSVFEDMLEKRGIPKNVTSMTSQDYSNKLGMLKQERIQKASKLPNYWDIRQQYLTEVNHLAKQKLDRQKAEQRGRPVRNTPLSSSMPLPAARAQQGSQRSSQGSPKRSPAPQRSSQGSPKRSPAPQRSTPGSRPIGQGIARFTKDPPKAAPRTPRGGAGVRNSQEYSQGDETIASGQWSSSEDDDDETMESDDDEEENGNARPMTSPRRPVTTTTAKTTKRVTTTVDESESDDDWDDDISGLEDVLEPVTQPRTSTARQSPSPRGQGKVAQLTTSIERQLSGRTAKKPAGAIDTMEMPESNKQHKQGEADLEDYSLTSISDGEEAHKPEARKVATRSSTQTDYSTNTYNTSAWGGSSKGGVSTANPQAANPRASANKSLSKQSTSADVSDDSWDSDDHNDLDISELK